MASISVFQFTVYDVSITNGGPYCMRAPYIEGRKLNVIDIQ